MSIAAGVAAGRSRAAMIGAIWRTLLISLGRFPVLGLPFLLISISYGLLLALLYILPQITGDNLVGTFIRALWGEPYIHYPFRVLILPLLMDYGIYAVNLTAGILLSATATAMIYQSFRQMRPRFRTALKRASKRYARLVLPAVALVALTFAVLKFIMYMLPEWWPSWAEKGVGYIVPCVFQAFFAIFIPAIIIGKKAAGEAVLLVGKILRSHGVEAFTLVAVPGLLHFAIIAVSARSRVIDGSGSNPEDVLWFMIVRIALLAIIDLATTGAAAYLFLIARERRAAREVIKFEQRRSRSQ